MVTLNNDVVTPLIVPLDIPTCKHHWVIEPPNGPISIGVCKYCGDSKEFVNTAQSAKFHDPLQDGDWAGDSWKDLQNIKE